MWLILAFLSAASLGVYDSLKKKALTGNAVVPILFLNTLISAIVLSPLIPLSRCGIIGADNIFHIVPSEWTAHCYILLKSVIVLSSWLLGYFGMKHLPLTIVGPINATRPVMVLVGALIIFGERLNGWQWAGVVLSAVSFLMLSRSSKKEGIDFRHNRWIFLVVGAAVMGAISGLYDRFLMAPAESGGAGLQPLMVQTWYTLYQAIIMGLMTLLLWWPNRRNTTPFHWDWAIIGISAFLTIADFIYFSALTDPDAMISIVSMIRRGSVLVSFTFGALFFHEKNLRAKFVDLILVLLGMICLAVGS